MKQAPGIRDEFHSGNVLSKIHTNGSQDMRFHQLLIFYLFFILIAFVAGEKQSFAKNRQFCVRGIVVGESSGDPIEGVHVWNTITEKGTVTDSKGYFELCESEDVSFLLVFSHITYKPFTLVVDKPTDKSVSVSLQEKDLLTGEIEIKGRLGRVRNEVSPGLNHLQSSDIFKVPALLGEADVVRALQQKPGVQSVSEGIGGIYVRGGGPGQNRLILDNMELMNPMHLMGIYSVFNPLTTSDVSLFKGHSPASIKSGLSSSILVSSKKPEINSHMIEGSIGNIASNITFSNISPNQKFSITTGLRRSYLELYRTATKTLLPEDENYFARTFYNFYDFNGVIRYHPHKTSTLQFSWYLGADDFSIDDEEISYDANTNYGNRGMALKWIKRIGANKSFASGVNYTSTWSSFSGDIITNNLDFKSNYERWAFNSQLMIENEKHLIRVGAEAYYYNTRPRHMKLIMPGEFSQNTDHFRSAEIDWFVEDTYQVLPNVKLYAGLRGHYYIALGPYMYHSDNVYEKYDRNEFINGTFHWFPSLSVAYHLQKKSTIKVAWSRNVQMIHLASLATMPLPNDIWMMSSPRISPQTGNQVSIEYQKITNSYSLTTGLFARNMHDQLIFNLNVNNDVLNFEDQFINGKGRAYGMEFSVNKESGDFNGGINYTLSRSERSFPDIYGGQWFSDKFDRTHDLSAMASYTLNKKWSFDANWIYATGNTMTLPAGRMWLMGSIMNDYEGFNNFRLPAYHRLDLSAHLKLSSKTFRESILDFSIINVYNRANPYFAFFKVYQGTSNYNIDISASQVSLFPLMPSVSWKFKF